MSDATLLLLDSDRLAAIRARWQERWWLLSENGSSTYVGDAWLTQTEPSGETTVLIDLDEPRSTELVFLRDAACAPDDIRALLGVVAAVERYLDNPLLPPSVLAEAIGRTARPIPPPRPPAFLQILRGGRARRQRQPPEEEAP